jgi:hypothetical protein
MIQHCYMCDRPLPSLIPSIKAKACITPEHGAQLMPSEDGSYTICLGCAPRMVPVYDVTHDDPLSAQCWVDAINEAWAKVEPQVDFYRHDYKQDTV